jgi:two-component system, NtrC family, sensor histidine kinase HydH
MIAGTPTPRPRRASLVRTFAILSLATIAVITVVQVTVQWLLLEKDLLGWERTTAAQTIRTEALSVLRPEDFVDWRGEPARDRFTRFFEIALSNAEILRVKIYDRQGTIVWSDEPRLIGSRFAENQDVRRALAGETVASLDSGPKHENLYDRAFGPKTVELYVPLIWPGSTPGTARVSGVVEVYKDAVRMFSDVARDRLVIVLTSMAGAVLLYAALFSIVRRASTRLETQNLHLERERAALATANRELSAMQAQLAQSERLAAIGEVSAAVAHGIRNPLANIRASAQLGKEFASEPEQVTVQFGRIVGEVDRLGTWLRSLLDAVRPFRAELGPLDLDAVVKDVLSVLQPRLAESQVKLECKLDSDLPMIQGDRALLEQALLGVLENAVDALPRGGTLVVESARAELAGAPAAAIKIRDDGDGIPPERLGRIFEPFVTTKSRGTGLGLAITRRVVEHHGGRIGVESEVGRGTTFTVTLPVPTTPPTSTEAS